MEKKLKLNFLLDLFIFRFHLRAFDHMLGLMKGEDPTIEGCLPTDGQQCQNPSDPNDPNAVWYPITPYAVENYTGGAGQSFVGRKILFSYDERGVF